MHLSQTGTILWILTQQKSGSSICIHSPKSIFHFLTVVDFGTSRVLVRWPEHDLLRCITFQHNNAYPHTAHWTQELMQMFHWDLSNHQPHCYECWSNIWDVADSTVTGKWKWSFMDGCEYRCLISTAGKFVNSCQDRTNSSMCLEMMQK